MLRLLVTMRIDVYLFEKGLSRSRSDAKRLIQEGCVFVSGVEVKKPAFEVTENDEVELILPETRYVSRGGLKLECAMNNFSLDFEGKLCIDIGSSTGGFTDCLLKNGASRVIAVDSGTNQLVPQLRCDERVFVKENFNARYMKASDLPYIPNLCVMDVSFISATHIIPAVFECLAGEGEFVLLIKPQFEVGRAGIGKGGIVKDDKARDNAVASVVKFAEDIGFKTIGVIRSSIIGGDGNIEYLAYFKKREIFYKEDL